MGARRLGFTGPLRGAALRSLLAAAALLGLVTETSAGEVCPTGPVLVQLIILQTPTKVVELARAVSRGVPLAARDATTVVFQDGRVITSDVESATRQLNRLGWGDRPIDVVASFGSRRARPARARG